MRRLCTTLQRSHCLQFKYPRQTVSLKYFQLRSSSCSCQVFLTARFSFRPLSTICVNHKKKKNRYFKENIGSAKMEKIAFIGTSKQGITKDINITVPWGQISAKTYGDSSNVPVICIHGWLDNANTFDELIPFLPKDKFYVMVDLPGHGHSSHLHQGMTYDIYLYINVIERVAEYYHFNSFSIVGHSLGGNVGAQYAATFPDKVDKVLMIDVPGVLPRPVDGMTKQLRESIVSHLKLEKNSANSSVSYDYDAAKRRLMTANTSLTDRAADILLERGAEQTEDGRFCYRRDPRHNLKYPMSMTAEVGVHFMSKIEAECVHIMAKDGMASKHPVLKNRLSELLGSFTSAQYREVIEVEGKHHVHLCNPEAVADHIKRILSRPKRTGLS